MQVVMCGKPDGYEYYDAEPLSDYETERAQKAGADAVVYWYGRGSYEGTGVALVRNGGKWVVEYLGHCSCYGPFENFDEHSFAAAKPLDELAVGMTKDRADETRELFEQARALS